MCVFLLKTDTLLDTCYGDTTVFLCNVLKGFFCGEKIVPQHVWNSVGTKQGQNCVNFQCRIVCTVLVNCPRYNLEKNHIRYVCTNLCTVLVTCVPCVHKKGLVPASPSLQHVPLCVPTLNPVRTTLEEFKKHSFIYMVRPTAHTNPSRKRSFRERSLNQRNLKMPALRFIVNRKTFWKRNFLKKDDVMWFPCPRFS